MGHLNTYQLLLISIALISIASIVVESSPFTGDSSWGVAHLSSSFSLNKPSCKIDGACNADGGGHGRLLMARIRKFISYAALRRNSIPRKRRGASYYNCNARQRASPYKRGCSRITRCYRYTDL
ncbi:hypothetical protein QQ045_026420 [Rhodiola kirilowii]